MRRLLIVGCGDIARRTLPRLLPHFRVYALLRNSERYADWRARGATPLFGDLDNRASLARIAGLADTVLHFAPPPAAAQVDSRTRNLLAALGTGRLPRQLLYLSTSGVYGDCGGAWIDETRPVHPQTLRAALRVDAERQIRDWASRNRVRAVILRVPGIYAAERLPLERLRSGLPAILAEQDSHTNHIHADDLARIVVAGLRHGGSNRVYHAVDDGGMKMGDYFDAVADACGLPRPPRLPRAEVASQVSAVLWSFLNESRCLDNRRLKAELLMQLCYPTVAAALPRIILSSSQPRSVGSASSGS